MVQIIGQPDINEARITITDTSAGNVGIQLGFRKQPAFLAGQGTPTGAEDLAFRVMEFIKAYNEQRAKGGDHGQEGKEKPDNDHH